MPTDIGYTADFGQGIIGSLALEDITNQKYSGTIAAPAVSTAA
jgi:hypothetical protein